MISGPSIFLSGSDIVEDAIRPFSFSPLRRTSSLVSVRTLRLLISPGVKPGDFKGSQMENSNRSPARAFDSFLYVKGEPMETSQLLAHCGTSRMSREELRTIPIPTGTATYQPLPHHEIVEALIESLSFRHENVRSSQPGDHLRGVQVFGRNPECQRQVDASRLDSRIPRFGLRQHGLLRRLHARNNVIIMGSCVEKAVPGGSRKMMATLVGPISIFSTRLRIISRLLFQSAFSRLGPRWTASFWN